MKKLEYISPSIENRVVVILPILDDNKSVNAEGDDITEGDDLDNSAKQMGTGFDGSSFDVPSWD